jgi:hypothetical protein
LLALEGNTDAASESLPFSRGFAGATVTQPLHSDQSLCATWARPESAETVPPVTRVSRPPLADHGIAVLAEWLVMGHYRHAG